MEVNSFLTDTAERLMLAGYPIPEVRNILRVLNSSSSRKGALPRSVITPDGDFLFSNRQG